MTSTDIALPDQGAIHLAPTDTVRSLAEWASELDAATRLAKVLCTTSFVPKEFRNKPDETAAAILTGAAMGLPPTTALQIMHVINGRVGTYAAGQVAILKSHGHDVWTESRSDTEVVVCGRRKGWPETRVARVPITIEQAKQAGWTTNNTYAKTPQDMLYARSATRVCKEVAPELLYGIPIVEELADLPPIQAEDVVQGAPQRHLTVADVLGDGAEPAPATEPDAATAEQRAELSRLLAATGRPGRTRAQQYIAKLLGRPVSGVADLSTEDAATVLTALRVEAEQNVAAPAEPAEVVWPAAAKPGSRGAAAPTLDGEEAPDA